MPTFYARSVFFVRDAARSIEFYTNKLGFTLDWNHEHEGRPHVVQVSLLGCALILNQIEPATTDRPGHGRVFIGLDPDQAAAFKQYVDENEIQTTTTYWGRPTIAIHDLDQNELFFWLPESDRAERDAGVLASPDPSLERAHGE